MKNNKEFKKKIISISRVFNVKRRGIEKRRKRTKVSKKQGQRID